MSFCSYFYYETIIHNYNVFSRGLKSFCFSFQCTPHEWRARASLLAAAISSRSRGNFTRWENRNIRIASYRMRNTHMIQQLMYERYSSEKSAASVATATTTTTSYRNWRNFSSGTIKYLRVFVKRAIRRGKQIYDLAYNKPDRFNGTDRHEQMEDIMKNSRLKRFNNNEKIMCKWFSVNFCLR